MLDDIINIINTIRQEDMSIILYPHLLAYL